MNVFELAARITLDTSAYEKGLLSASGRIADFALKTAEITGSVERFSQRSSAASSGIAALAGSVGQLGTAFASGGLQTLVRQADTQINGFVGRIYAAVPKISAGGASMSRALSQGISSGTQAVAGTAAALTTAFSSGITSGAGRVRAAASGIMSAARSAMSSMTGGFSSIGSAMVSGVWSGLSSSGSWLRGRISGWASGITSYIKRQFGIASPSKVMRDEVGVFLALGIGEGFRDAVPRVFDDMQAALELRKLDTAMKINVSEKPSGSSSGRLAGVTVNQNVYSRALSAAELMEEARLSARREALGFV